MTRQLRYLLFSAVLLACRPCTAAPTPILPVERVRPGMTGYGLTVFRGDSIEEFQVRILGTLNNFMPRKDVILAELLGERLQHTGVVAGMSGSPVYIDGKLIGAVAYGWSFSKDPIAGITPIQQMLDIPVDTTGSAPAEQTPEGQILNPGSTGEIYNPFQPPADPLLAAEQPENNIVSGTTAAHLERLAVPLVFSGCRPDVIERFGPAFRRLGLIPVLGGSAAGADTAGLTGQFEAGAPVAAQLVRGDLSLAATGTLTWRDGNRILAFGHPFLQFGPVNFPMTAAEIVAVLPNLSSSFKLSNATRCLGTIRTDHANGVLGLLGGTPDLLPFHLKLDDNERGHEEFNFELVRHKRLTPTLSSLVLLNSLTSRGDIVTERSYGLQARIELGGGLPPVEINDLLAGPNSAVEAIQAVQLALQYLYANQFGPADVRQVEMNLSIRDGNPRALVSEVYLDRTTVYPGDTLGLDVLLKPVNGPKRRESFRLALPDLGEDSRLFVLVGSGDMLTRTEFQLSPSRFRYTSLAHLVQLINASRREDRVYVKIFRQDRGLLVENRELDNLPLSVWSLLRSGNTSGAITPLADVSVIEAERPADCVISGFRLLQLDYKQNR